MEHPHHLTRWYIDTRPLTSSTTTLPLLSSLTEADQTSVQKYYHTKDKHMSLASNLLKYFFIHQTCRVPWSSIVISRTPDPHRRPCYIPNASSDTQNTQKGETPPKIEFNVSHQASMVAIVGTVIPPAGTEGANTKLSIPEVGVDITCVNERQSPSVERRTLASLHSYIDIFSEVFSASEIMAMKTLDGVPPGLDEERRIDYGYRLFYTYWALKEAYIKMTGEALLAPWLRELEFSDVVAPAAERGDGVFGEPYRGIRTTLHRKLVEDVRIEVVALEKDYLMATAARGGGVGVGVRLGLDDGEEPWRPFTKLDIEKDIRPCATGACGCSSWDREDITMHRD
ncbi:hypothetical protein BJX99DRAFT_226469 [Aspergillus californicus]